MMERLRSRLVYALGLGRTRFIDDSGSVQTAQVVFQAHDRARRVTNNVPVIAHYGLTSRPPANSDAVAVFLEGDPSSGLVIATNHQTYRLRNLGEGEVALYDQWGNVVHLTEGQITLKHATKVRVESPRLEVTGDVVDRCDEQPATLADLREDYQGHRHSEVRSGPDESGLTTLPLPT